VSHPNRNSSVSLDNHWEDEQHIRKATRLIVEMGRQSGKDESRIRAETRRAMKDALSDSGVWKRRVTVPGDSGSTEVVTAAGIYRLVMAQLSSPSRVPVAEETWWTIASEAIEEALVESGEDFPPILDE
jgi:hypothetical protein